MYQVDSCGSEGREVGKGMTIDDLSLEVGLHPADVGHRVAGPDLVGSKSQL